MRQPTRRGPDLRHRYTVADTDVLTEEEIGRFIGDGSADPQTNVTLAWELLYRREPELYDRLAQAERLHPAVIDWLPTGVDRIVEVGAGTGRLTLELVGRARELVAIEPAAPFRKILERKLSQTEHGCSASVIHGFFDDLPVADDSADVVVVCSAFTSAPAHGGDIGLAEMERICRPGGCVVIVWPLSAEWLADRGYQHLSFPGEMFVEFSTADEAAELTEIFYPAAVAEVRRNRWRRVPFRVLGTEPPRDLAYKVMPEGDRSPPNG
jgi:SAM-dependent methyltransferase